MFMLFSKNEQDAKSSSTNNVRHVHRNVDYVMVGTMAKGAGADIRWKKIGKCLKRISAFSFHYPRFVKFFETEMSPATVSSVL